jgi:hypothetical protein
MNVTHDSLQRVDSHWAVLAIGAAARNRGLDVANARLVRGAIGQQISIEFSDEPADDDLLRRLALAYEMAAIEGLNAFNNPTSDSGELREQCAAGAWRTFEIRRLFRFPKGDDERVFHVLHVSALAYCGDRWSDLRRWYNENASSLEIPSLANADWQHRLVYRLFDCWVRLFRKNRWNDLDQIRAIIVGLREDQKNYESGALEEDGADTAARATALRLISLYHWAKGTELLAQYMLQGEPADIGGLLDKHFEAAIAGAAAGVDSQLEILMRWLHTAARQMVAGSIWWVTRAVNSRVSRFVREVTKQQAMFELLPPQRAALQEQGLLDQAATAVVVDMPTSGGKTLLAQFRILQALNQFDVEHGWVAYVTPTRALTAQISRRLRRDFEPIGVRVEHLSGGIEIDAFEEDFLTKPSATGSFHVLVSTPEKLQLVIRNKKVPRPLALVVMDEAHNMEDETRGLRIELLLATIKRDCASANFLLLMPYVEKAETLARWLAQDVNAGRSISFGTTVWKPNDRVVGVYRAEVDSSVKSGWRLIYRTLTTTPKTLHLTGTHKVGGLRPLNLPKSRLINATSGHQTGLGLQTAAIARIMADRGTSIAVGRTINSVWGMAREVHASLANFSPVPDEISLVQKFLKTEISPDFELVDMLARGVGVHHAGLSDEVRALIEWLAEEGKLRVLCATTTIAQGINFPVSSVFLASRSVPFGTYSREMPPRDFWNLAGRAGRIDHDSVGVVGIAEGNDLQAITEYVQRATGALVSRLEKMLNELEAVGKLNQLDTVIQTEQWDDFRCYVAHLWNEKKKLDAVLADTEQLLRNTYGYDQLRASVSGQGKAEKLLEATKKYASTLAENPGHAQLADMTGFSPEGVRRALIGLNQLEQKITPDVLAPASLFGPNAGMADLFGVMLRVPQLAGSLRDVGGSGFTHERIAEVTKAWVNGLSIQDIAANYFVSDSGQTSALTDACRAIYRAIVNAATWGVSALSHLSGIDFDALSEVDRRRINILPAMIYHGVRTEEAVLMRMNAAPRSVAEKLGEEYRSNSKEDSEKPSVQKARQFLKSLAASDWGQIRPKGTFMSGDDYKRIWELLSGEAR